LTDSGDGHAGITAAQRSGMKDTIDVFELLESQHTEFDQLIEQLERGDKGRAALFAELADKLAAHSTAEEKIFYPAAMDAKTSDLLHDSVEEHLAIRRLLADMMEMDADDDEDFDDKLLDLKERVSHHAHDKEENKLFPILRRLMSEDERAAVGNEVLAMFESLIEHEPRRNLPSETAKPAPLPGL
jgi:hemerythrin-like domain-containing protein